MIDLHLHSTASDGTCSPSELLSLAVNLNLSAISITDHDTIAGVIAVREEGIPDNIEFLNGVEISAASPPLFILKGSFHILGYGINLDNIVLNSTLKTLQNARKNRNPQIIERLNDLGFNITLEEVKEYVGDGQLGRPHIARLMVKKGFSASINEAFDNYLGKGESAYVDKYRVECEDAIRIIKEAGGIAVLAHPFLVEIKNTDKDIRDLISDMKNMGLDGLEVFYPEHSKKDTAKYEEMAKDLSLVITGGTDFHGNLKPSIQMGIGSGNLKIPDRIYYDILTKLK